MLSEPHIIQNNLHMNQNFLSQWAKLENLSKEPLLRNLQSLFSSIDDRVEKFSFESGSLYIDFSKNLINEECINQLIKLAQYAKLEQKIKSMFSGDIVNYSENKPATHIFQRQTKPTKKILDDRQNMFKIAKNYSSGKWKTAFNQNIKYLVNIGIGGSYLGPKLAIESLTSLQTTNKIKVLFYPCVDDTTLTEILNSIDITSTLFCISSKSLETIETIRNTETIIQILHSFAEYKPRLYNQSIVAATANFNEAKTLKIPHSHIMPFDNATGGRFSVWSSIGFPVLVAIGETRFKEFLSGAEISDNHFKNTALEKNLPVLMALISIWYRNFIKLPAYSIIPYDIRLKSLPLWLQQLMMESNGKMLDIYGAHIAFSSSPWVFGDHGQLSQHAFFQAFHQGSDIIPIDFIGVIDNNSKSQNFLNINMVSQSAALMNGYDFIDDKQCYCPGNRPSTTILLKDISASTIGQLLAMYEHMIYVQSVIWNINCFDQPGVELGKKMAENITEHLLKDTLDEINLDYSTTILLKRILDD